MTTPAKAVRSKDLVNQVGPTKALEVLAATERTGSVLTVGEWIGHHIDHLTGVEQETIRRYRSYLANDIAPTFGATPLAALSRDEIALWVNAMFEESASGKTIANKQRFLSGALNAAVAAGHITTNPCHGLRLPGWERREMVFLTESEFAILLNAVTEYWRPFVMYPRRFGRKVERGDGTEAPRRRPSAGHRTDIAGVESHERRPEARPAQVCQIRAHHRRRRERSGQARLRR